jgi:phosphatidyl-myo-inositol dimannoside synthase
MLRILYLTHLHPPADAPLTNMGGMQRVSLQLVETLKKNPDVVIETIQLQAEWGNIGITTTQFLLKNAVELPVKVQQFNPDVVVFSSMVTASLAPFLRKKIDVPLVTINHGQDVTKPVSLYQWFVPKIFKALDGVISVSRATKQACIDRGLPFERGIAIPNGFLPEDFNVSKHTQQQAREELGRLLKVDLSNKNVLLTTGRLVKRKGHAWFIRNVLPALSSDFTYLILGDGPERDSIEKAIIETSASDHIYLLGRQSDDVLNLTYKAADLFIMPNIVVPGDMEGFGVVMLEANLAGTPVVASDLEGIKDVIEDGMNGYKIPVGEAGTFASVIDQLLKGDLSKLAETSRTYVFDNFTWDKVAQRYIDYLVEVSKSQKMTN